MRPALVTALLGLVLALTAATFDAEPLYVPGAAFIVLAAGAVAWVHVTSRRLRISRTISARRALEDDAIRIDIRVRTGSLALPAGMIDDPLLPAPAPIGAGRRSAHLVIDARFGRRGRKRLLEPSVIVRDPFGLATRVVQGGGEAEAAGPAGRPPPGRGPRRGPVYYGAGGAPGRPPRALSHAPGGGRVLVV